jgi:hypothetical protein
VVKLSAFVIRSLRVRITWHIPTVLTEVSCDFVHSANLNAKRLLRLRSLPFVFLSFTINYSLIMSFVAVLSERLKMSLNKVDR